MENIIWVFSNLVGGNSDFKEFINVFDISKKIKMTVKNVYSSNIPDNENLMNIYQYFLKLYHETKPYSSQNEIEDAILFSLDYLKYGKEEDRIQNALELIFFYQDEVAKRNFTELSQFASIESFLNILLNFLNIEK